MTHTTKTTTYSGNANLSLAPLPSSNLGFLVPETKSLGNRSSCCSILHIGKIRKKQIRNPQLSGTSSFHPHFLLPPNLRRRVVT
jgi:hypothetical protein